MHTTTSKAKNFYGRRPKSKKLSNQDKKIARIAKRVVQAELDEEIELKAYDRDVGFTAITDTGVNIFSLSDTIAQGTTTNARIGDKIKIKNLFVRLQIDATSLAQYVTLRVIVFRWLSNDSPSVTDILSLTGAAVNRPLSQLNYANRASFQIKYDNTYVCGGDLNVSTAVQNGLPQSQVDKFYIKNIGDAQWKPGGVVPLKGHLYMLMIGDAPVNRPEVAFTSRTKYQDA